jgi:glutamate racemase
MAMLELLPARVIRGGRDRGRTGHRETVELPIGVFDSGVGGLTALRALAHQWPGETFLYLADTARLPYGTKSPETLEQYLMQNIKFLLQRGVKAIVVACNSASTVLLAKKIPSPVPVLNVINPGSKRAASLTETNRIGIIGTRATVLSEAYVRTLKSINPDLQVFQQACPLLVPLIEENWIHDPLTNMVLYRYLQTILQEGIDVLVMGCTHYPILKDSIQKITGQDVQLVDASMGLIAEIEQSVELREGAASSGGEIQIACTDLTPQLEKLMHQLLEPFVPNSVRVVEVG